MDDISDDRRRTTGDELIPLPISVFRPPDQEKGETEYLCVGLLRFTAQLLPLLLVIESNSTDQDIINGMKSDFSTEKRIIESYKTK